jgi:hypothetical protein
LSTCLDGIEVRRRGQNPWSCREFALGDGFVAGWVRFFVLAFLVLAGFAAAARLPSFLVAFGAAGAEVLAIATDELPGVEAARAEELGLSGVGAGAAVGAGPGVCVVGAGAICVATCDAGSALIRAEFSERAASLIVASGRDVLDGR